MTHNHAAFDEVSDLADLLPERERQRIEKMLTALLEQPVRLLPGTAGLTEAASRVPVMWDLEPLGYLDAPGLALPRLKAAAKMVESILNHAARYRMAAALHEETTCHDFKELQAKHAALQASETKYRMLAAHLEERVAEQVRSLQAAQNMLYQNEKMASVGRLAAGMAHEINNPLAYITSNLEAAKTYLASLAALRDPLFQGDIRTLQSLWQSEDLDFVIEDFIKLIQDALEGSGRVSAIVSSLKTFSNVNGSERQLDDINERLQTVVKIVRPELGQDIEVRLDLGRISPIFCHPGHLGQVFYNLILNGAQAIPHTGVITVSTHEQGDHIHIRFEDSGCGIPESDLQRIFEPFFTTKDVGQGTGLGLSVSREIISAHGGAITAKSSPGEGTTITITLPITRIA